MDEKGGMTMLEAVTMYESAKNEGRAEAAKEVLNILSRHEKDLTACRSDDETIEAYAYNSALKDIRRDISRTFFPKGNEK